MKILIFNKRGFYRIHLLIIIILFTTLVQPLWSQSLKDQFNKQGDDLISNLNSQIKESGYLRKVDRSWKDFEKYVLNFKNGVYGYTYTFYIPYLWDADNQVRIDIVDKFFECSGIESYRGPEKMNPDIYFHTDGKFFASSIPYDLRLSQSEDLINLKLSSSLGGIRLFEELGSINQNIINSNCEDVFIELENPLSHETFWDSGEETFYYMDNNSKEVYKNKISIGEKDHGTYVTLFVARQCSQIEILSSEWNEISKTEEAKKIKSKIMKKIEQHSDYILWAFRQFYSDHKLDWYLDENNLCSMSQN